jgi:hypothetical protein
MPVKPINEAEAIIEPFWDPALSELSAWSVESGTKHGLLVRQNWCWVSFEWARRPETGSALKMRRVFGVDCGDYDRLVLSVMPPENTVLRMIADTDRGLLRLEARLTGIIKKELALDLKGATRLEAVTIEVETGSDGIAKGWFNWIGLQHSARLEHMLKTRSSWDSRWDKYLKDESFEPEFKPRYGLVLDSDELDAMRERHEVLTAEGKPSPFAAAASAAQSASPEAMIHDFVNFWGDSRYSRERDYGKFILNHGLNAAVAGYLLRDKHLLRLAARYAMSIGMCKNWDDGFVCRFPGGTFEHRCFVQSLCAYEVAGILDLAGEYFTGLWRDFLLRRLAEGAIGAIQYNTWRHDYIFQCNQLAWFMPARLSPVPSELQPFVCLPDMGPLVSHRLLGGHWVKLFIQGNKTWAGHAHEDKGSFVLEFAGDTFAMDPGTCDYSNPMAGILQQCERHNMLVPFGLNVRPAPQNPLPHDVKPRGTGDAISFHAEIEATPGWEPYYRHWHRKWDSPKPDVMTVTDDYELAAGDGVEFYWQTRLPVRLDGVVAVITGRQGRVEVEAPEGCTWRLDELPLLDGIQHRLAFRLAGKSGHVAVQARLIVGN